MATETKRRANKKYNKKADRFTVDFYPTEKALFEHLSKQPAKQTYIKNLIRADMARNEQKNG